MVASSYSQGIGINNDGSKAHPSAQLDIKSIQKGFLPPRMSTAQRNAISNPDISLLIYNLDTDCLNYFSSDGVWVEMCGEPIFDCGGPVSFIYNGVMVTNGTIERDYSSLPSPYDELGKRCWLDRNLGAIELPSSDKDPDSFGDLYQWGRFSDEHQFRLSPIIKFQANTPTPSLGNPWDGRFIVDFTDWLNPSNNDLWNIVSGVNINNPCPSGWRLPTEIEWFAEMSSWGANQNAFGAFLSDLSLTLAGYRTSTGSSAGDIINEGVEGLYWSQTIDNASGMPFVLYFANGFATVTRIDRAFGGTVRCIKE